MPLQSHLRAVHLLSMEWLKQVRARRSLIGEIERATTNAIFAFEKALAGYRQRDQLRRTSAALRVCRSGFEVLCFESYIHERAFHEIGRRIDQLLPVLDQLATIPRDEWAKVLVPFIESKSAEHEDATNAGVQRIRTQVADILRMIGPIAPVATGATKSNQAAVGVPPRPGRIKEAA